MKKLEVPGELDIQCRVRVDGLNSAAHYNGTLGTVEDYDAKKKRWIVLMDVDFVKNRIRE